MDDQASLTRRSPTGGPYPWAEAPRLPSLHRYAMSIGKAPSWKSPSWSSRARGFAERRRHRFAQVRDRAPAPHPAPEPVQVEINDRRGVECDKLGQQQTADDGDAQRAAQFGAGAALQR